MTTDRRLLGTAKLASNNACYTRQRTEFKERCRSRNLPCHICHGELGPIDYSAEPQTSKAFELDHYKPVSTHPHLYYMVTNWRPSHSACNRSRQAKKLDDQPEKGSTKWVKPQW
jgi:hypothetical protein